MTPITRTTICLLLFAGAPAAAPLLASARDVPEHVTWSEHVAPIVFSNCAGCHRPNDVAPMSLLGYADARPWAKSIRKAVLAREMPPWDADPHYGTWRNDTSLSEQEIAVIQRWVDQGAPEGDPALAPAAPGATVGWKMGQEPDYTIELAPIDVPAGGPDLFVTQVYAMTLPPGKWVRAIELLPGNNKVLHHVVTYLGPFGIREEEEMASAPSNAGINQLVYLNEEAKRPVRMTEVPRVGAVWVAGAPPARFREGTGHPLQPNQRVSFNMHYHPSGEAGRDASKLGFYFGEGPLEKEMTTAFAADPGIFIPAGSAHHAEHAVYRFAQDSKILSFLPHMHQRGKSMKYTLTRPGGTPEVLLSVPAYDYNWQNIYQAAEPIPVPAGSLIEVEATWDNSAGNPANPDATVDVPWGDGTNLEMLVAFLDFIVDQGERPAPVNGADQIRALLARHDPSSSYELLIDGMTFGGPMGLVLPPQGEGVLYVTFGSLMFTTSIPVIHRVGNETIFDGHLVTGSGGTRMPLGMRLEPSAGGGLQGEIFFGKSATLETIAGLRGTGRPVTVTPVSAVPAAATGAGAR